MSNINEIIDSMKNNIIKSTCEIVRIRSVMDNAKPGMPYGERVDEALKYVLELSEQLGFRTVNVDGYMGYAEYGEGKEMIAVLGHMDIVPEGDGWDYPPYGGEIHDEKIFGRGTIDNKGPMIAALYGLKAIKEAGLILSKRVRILFGTNEENGSKEVPYYTEREELPVAGFTPDAEYPIIYAEKGILIFKVTKKFKKKNDGKINFVCIKGGNAPNMVPDYCEAVIKISDKNYKDEILNKLSDYLKETNCNIIYKDDNEILTLISRGISAHGSLPDLGLNAVMQMMMFLSCLDGEGDAKEYIDFFAQTVGMDTKGEKLGIYLKDATGELSFNAGIINLNEEGASMSLNIRYPVTFKTSDVMDKFNEAIKSYGLKVEDMLEQHPLYYPKNNPLIKTLQRVYKEQTGLEPLLLAIGGGTYAKEMPNIVAFGPIFPGKPDLDHKANEYIEINDLIMNAKIYGNAIYELSK